MGCPSNLIGKPVQIRHGPATVRGSHHPMGIASHMTSLGHRPGKTAGDHTLSQETCQFINTMTYVGLGGVRDTGFLLLVWGRELWNVHVSIPNHWIGDVF